VANVEMNVMKACRGVLSYVRFPEQRKSWGGPFNGQEGRKKIFEELSRTISFSCIVETGTYRGTTTDYFERSAKIPIISIEIEDFSFGYAKFRFLFHKCVNIYYGDSRTLLKNLFDSRALTDRETFFYLDAHWGDDLPLIKEIDLIFGHNPNAIAMVDDFQVPDDPGYKFDDFGERKILNLDYLRDVITRFDLSVFFPVCRSEHETGAKRGSVVLARGFMAESLTKLVTLREFKE
jgi:hypothetical protein